MALSKDWESRMYALCKYYLNGTLKEKIACFIGLFVEFLGKVATTHLCKSNDNFVKQLMYYFRTISFLWAHVFHAWRQFYEFDHSGWSPTMLPISELFQHKKISNDIHLAATVLLSSITMFCDIFQRKETFIGQRNSLMCNYGENCRINAHNKFQPGSFFSVFTIY